MSDTVIIKTYLTRLDAEMAQSLLEANNIKAIVEGDDCGGLQPNIALVSGGFDLIVSQADSETAKELLGGSPE